MGLTKASYAMITGAPVNVKDFGAVGNGTTDDTTAIQNAVNSLTNGGQVFFPTGTYLISSQISVSNNWISLVGENRRSTQIKQGTANSKIFNITGSFVKVCDLGMFYGSTPTSGATAIYCTGNYCHFTDFLIRNSYKAMEFTGGAACKVTDFEIFDYEHTGINAYTLNDLFVARFIMNAGNTSRGIGGGIVLNDKVEAFICSDGDILLGQYSMQTGAASYSVGARPAYNNFTNVFFDSSYYGVKLDKMVETEFVGCWFSGGRAASGYGGCTIYQTDSLSFVASRFFNCGGDGCSVTANANRTNFIGCSFESNSVTSGSGVAHGLAISPNTNNFTVTNCKASNDLFGGQQGYGIIVNAGTSTNYAITNNIVTGNITGGISDGGTGASRIIQGNFGYTTVTKGLATIPAGQSAITVNHGLSAIPGSGIMLTFHSSPVVAGITSCYVTNITSTQFTIGLNTTVASGQSLTVAWEARTRGA